MCRSDNIKYHHFFFNKVYWNNFLKSIITPNHNNKLNSKSCFGFTFTTQTTRYETAVLPTQKGIKLPVYNWYPASFMLLLRGYVMSYKHYHVMSIRVGKMTPLPRPGVCMKYTTGQWWTRILSFNVFYSKFLFYVL